MSEAALRPVPTWASSDGHLSISGPRQATEPGERRALDGLLAIETVNRFAFSFGERDRTVLRDCFTQDATFSANIGGTTPTGRYEGREDVVGWLTGYWDRQVDQRRHLVCDAVVDGLDDQHAVVTALLLLAASEAGAMRLNTAGFYRCELRRESDGAWRIADFRAGYDAPY